MPRQLFIIDALISCPIGPVLGVLCSAMDNSGCTAEFLLKQKVQSLGKSSTSTLNKILRIVGAGAQPSAGTSRGKSSDAESIAPLDKAPNPQMSEESVRKLNAKRKKIARHLLKKIQAKSKRDGAFSNSTSVVTTPLASPPKALLTAKSMLLEASTLVEESGQITGANKTSNAVGSHGMTRSSELLRRTKSTQAELTKAGQEQPQQQFGQPIFHDKQRVAAGDSPMGPSPSGEFIIGSRISDEPSLDCAWIVFSAGEEQDEEELSSSSDESELSSGSK